MDDAILEPPETRRRDLARVGELIERSRRVALTTHVNADGDGAGSEAAVAHHLTARGIETAIVNPTPFPEAFRFLLEDRPAWTLDDARGEEFLEGADALLVLDTSEPERLGAVRDYLDRTTVAVIDHHPASPASVGDVVARDPGACATGELIWDLLRMEGDGPAPAVARGLYVAIVTDTGSFRFGNTTARAHAIAGRLIRAGVDVESMFRHIFARYTPQGLDLLRRALASLDTSGDGRVAWITLRHADLEETGADAEDREGLVEYARRLRGVEVAILFRELRGGRTKVSLRSNGGADVSAIARGFGGGGHRQAAGILLERSLEETRREVVSQVRDAVRQL